MYQLDEINFTHNFILKNHCHGDWIIFLFAEIIPKSINTHFIEIIDR